jgi:hypothetical protein
MPPTSDPTPARRDDAARRVQGRLMAQSLGLLLDRVRGAREVLPHLGALERGLLQHGVDAVSRIPPHWLQKICSQLSSLPIPEQDPPLHDLLDRLLGAMQGEHGPQHLEGEFDPERTVVIREVSHSDFMAAAAEQATTLHGPE